MKRNIGKAAMAWLALLLMPAAGMAQQAKSHRISTVEEVKVSVNEGNAPQLPYLLWVEYADGRHEYRQVRWNNAALETEERMADARQTPAGTRYTVGGFIVGDETTGMGYPVEASVTVVADMSSPTPKPVAEPLPLNKVSLQGDNRLTRNRDMDIDQLLCLDVSQQLYNYRDTYGMSTEGYTVADGWDSPTTKLKGHGSGHYMSAMAMAYACCTDPAKKAQLKKNISRMVNELRQCQKRTFVWDKQKGRYREARDLAPEEELREMKGSWQDFDRYKKQYQNYGYGYLNAIPPQHCALVEVYRPYNNEQWVWAPYYSIHKQLAGLIDIATYVDDRKTAAKALLIARDMGLWVWNRMHYRTFLQQEGTQEERRAKPGNRFEMWNMYIAGEVGGMAESLSRLSEMVKDKQSKQRLLEAASCFDSPAFFNPLAVNVDAIRSRHANQHIPMVTGALRSYRSNRLPRYYRLAHNFWAMVQGRYRYAMGGVGNGEMFRQPYSQMMSMCTNVSRHPQKGIVEEPTLNETCCAYNLAKLTKELNCFTPNDARYMDYYERVLYNQIVGSLNPKQYQTVYQYAVGVNASKPWGNETPQSTCCGGTGVENHVKYQEACYFADENTLWVALYLPTTAVWDAKKTVIRQECEWPAERSILRITKGKPAFAMKLRVPYWATEGFEIKLNGVSLQTHYQPCSYAEIPMRRWSADDVVEITMPFCKHIDYCPDKMSTAPKDGEMATYTPAWAGALMNGPLVMAAEGISNWDEATLNISSDLREVEQHAASGATATKANRHALACNGMVFIPDYDADRHITHYFRLHFTDSSSLDTASGITDEANATWESLKEAMLVAAKRIGEQEEWMARKEKITPDAPWAPHAFARMKALYMQAKELTDRADDKAAQQAGLITTELKAVINTMRPGNLPEPEDLQKLAALLDKAKKIPHPSQTLQNSISYAEMVVRYVSDGSGTRDMIERAERQLR